MTKHLVWACDFCKVTVPDTGNAGWTEYDVHERTAGRYLEMGSYTVCPECLSKQPDQTSKGFLRRVLAKLAGGD